MSRAILAVCVGVMIGGCAAEQGNWYERSFYLLHEDHHTTDRFAVGREADFAQTSRLVGLSKPDVIQIHAKGNPGWTTYPSKVGYPPSKLARDVLGIWRDVARQDGYHFSAYYNIGRDGEIMKRHPEWNRVKADGTPYDKMLCYHSGVAEAYLWPMIREIIDGYQPDGFWFDGSCFTVRPCYCSKCRERFRRERGMDAPQSPSEAGWADYQEMQRQIYRAFIHETIAVIHERAPACLVAVNWAYSLLMPEKPDAGIAYLTGDVAKFENLSAEARWYDAQDLPFDLMTQINTLRAAGSTEQGQDRMVPKPRGQMEQEMAVVIANGGRYFAWDYPTPESGLVPERFAYLGRVVAPFLRSRQPWCLGSKRVADVSLLHSAATHYAVADRGISSFARPDNRIDGATSALARLRLNYEFVPDWRMAAQDVRSPLLIVEHAKMLTDASIDQLCTYVRNGGTLLITGMGIALDRRLQTLCGVREVHGPKGAAQLVMNSAGERTTFGQWLFRVELSTAEPLMFVADAQGQHHAVLTRNAYGRGQACYAAIPLLSRDERNVVPDAFMQTVFDVVLPPEKRNLITTGQGIEAVLRRKGEACILHLVNVASVRGASKPADGAMFVEEPAIPATLPCHVSIRLARRPDTLFLQPRGLELKDSTYANGRLELDVHSFDIHQMVVVR